jgi:hypothetical protein
MSHMVLQPPDQFSLTVLLFAELLTASLYKSLTNLWILCFLYCASTQLCNVNQQTHTFEINVLIQLTASTCFEHRVHQHEDHFYMQFGMVWFSYIHINSLAGGRNEHIHLLDCLHKCMKNIPYKTACTNDLPCDEHMMFKTCRRCREFK